LLVPMNAVFGPRMAKSKGNSEVPAITTRWTRLVLGFGVSVAIGLAPYLGLVKVPLFAPLLSLIPVSIQNVALPLSAASMGVVAVFIQWYGFQRYSKHWLNTSFRRVMGVPYFARNIHSG